MCRTHNKRLSVQDYIVTLVVLLSVVGQPGSDSAQGTMLQPSVIPSFVFSHDVNISHSAVIFIILRILSRLSADE